MSAHFSPMNTLHSSKVEWTMYTDGMKLAGPKVNYVQVFTSTELHLERKNNTKRPHVKTKPKEFSSLCHCYHRVYNGDKCPLRITLLDRFAWKPGQFTHLGAWWSTKIWRMNCRWNGWRANFQSKQQTIFVSLEVFSTVKRKGRHCYLSYFETWGTVKIFCKLTSNLSNITSKAKISPWKGRCCSESP